MVPSRFNSFAEVIKSLGVVFGDIGTSPLYTLNALLLMASPTPENIFGFISLIVWTLVFLVFIEYALLAMSLGKKGEGGTIVLKELLVPLLRSPRHIVLVTFLSFIGISLFIGDGVITPAVSILSAVQGIPLIPSLHRVPQAVLILLACFIAIFLFIFQKRGTERVAVAFGPLMFLWFATLGFSGAVSIGSCPAIIKALNPFYAIRFMVTHGIWGFLILSGVILCATGGEALYADMGHLGRKPILRAWYFVFICLLLSYLGQGAFLINNPHASRLVLYNMVFSQTTLFYLPFLILSLLATVIASQALISGVFSVVYQGITTGVMPHFKVDFTSSRLRAQVYIGSVNWMLLLAVLFMMVNFKNSDNLTNAYGLAVTGTMTLTGIMMAWIFYKRHALFKMGLSLFIVFVDFAFFCASLYKIPNGGYWSLIIAMIPFLLILIYTNGQRRVREALSPVALEEFLEKYIMWYKNAVKIKGSALFFVRDVKLVPPFVMQTIFENNILYEDNIIISVITRDDPFGVIGFFKGALAPGIRIFEIHRGYMEMLDVEKILKNASIDAHVIFYGLEEIVTKNPVWKFFAGIKRLVPSFAQFYRIPSHKLHGVVTLIEI